MEQPRSRQPLELRQRVDSADGRGEVTIRGTTEVARRIDGDVTVTSGDVVVSGVITGSLYVVGGHVRVVGTVGGSVENLGGVVDILGVVEGEVLGPPPATRIFESAIVGQTTNDEPKAATAPPVGYQSNDTDGRRRKGSGLLGVAAAVALVGVVIFGANDTPLYPDNASLAIVEVDRSSAELLEVAGAVEFRAPEPVEPLSTAEFDAELERTSSLLDDLPRSGRSSDAAAPGSWIVPPSIADGCLPWEQMVDESAELVTVSLEPCKVMGRWSDALSADESADADGIIVHPLVPVDNVVQSGGAEWDADTIRSYLTDNTSPETLQVMSERRVIERNGQAPDRWQPTNTAVWCAYATDWITVKTRWGLTVTAAEARWLQEMIATCGDASSNGPNPTHARSDRPVAPIGLVEGVGDGDGGDESGSESNESTFFTCDDSYPGLCIPAAPPVLTCDQVGVTDFVVDGNDPHGFDPDNDGVGCQGS